MVVGDEFGRVSNPAVSFTRQEYRKLCSSILYGSRFGWDFAPSKLFIVLPKATTYWECSRWSNGDTQTSITPSRHCVLSKSWSAEIAAPLLDISQGQHRNTREQGRLPSPRTLAAHVEMGPRTWPASRVWRLRLSRMCRKAKIPKAIYRNINFNNFASKLSWKCLHHTLQESNKHSLKDLRKFIFDNGAGGNPKSQLEINAKRTPVPDASKGYHSHFRHFDQTRMGRNKVEYREALPGYRKDKGHGARTRRRYHQHYSRDYLVMFDLLTIHSWAYISSASARSLFSSSYSSYSHIIPFSAL